MTGEIFGDLADKLRGNLAGEIGGDLAGDIRDDLVGEIRDDFAGEIRGDFAGEIRGDLEGEISGDFNGAFAVSSVLLLHHFLTNELLARRFRGLSVLALPTASGASVMAAAFSKDFVSGSSVSGGRNFLGRPLRSTRFSTIVSVAVSCVIFFLISGKTISSPVLLAGFRKRGRLDPLRIFLLRFSASKATNSASAASKSACSSRIDPGIDRRRLPIIKDLSSVSFFADLSISPFRLAVVATGLTNTFSFGERLFIFLSFFRHFFVFRLTR